MSDDQQPRSSRISAEEGEPATHRDVAQGSEPRASGRSADGPRRSTDTQAHDELPYIDDPFSRVWVLGLVAVFGLIVLYGVLFGRAGLLSPGPVPSPTPIVSPGPVSPTPILSPSPAVTPTSDSASPAGATPSPS